MDEEERFRSVSPLPATAKKGGKFSRLLLGSLGKQTKRPDLTANAFEAGE
jgi:hypothetical protein